MGREVKSMSELDRCYQLFGLKVGASLEDLNRAYKDLAIVWHPDRLPKDNDRLLQIAEEKIKEINHEKSIQVNIVFTFTN